MTSRIDTTAENERERYISCFAEKHAAFLSFFPRYWEAMTAPPVENAEKRNTNRFETESTSDTPETACSPSVATMIVSIMPIVTDKSVSIRRGMISALR